MSVKVWVRMMWQDDRLKWNKSEYGGLGTARVRVRSLRFASHTLAAARPFQTNPTARTTLPNILPPAQFWAHNSDDAEIWVPDITTYNTRGSLADHVGGAWVDVYSSGGTWYSRAGTLEVLCKFQGLVSFPFDKDVRRPRLIRQL